MDVKTASLHGIIDQLLYVEVPKGYEQQSRDQVCLLKKKSIIWTEKITPALVWAVGRGSVQTFRSTLITVYLLLRPNYHPVALRREKYIFTTRREQYLYPDSFFWWDRPPPFNFSWPSGLHLSPEETSAAIFIIWQENSPIRLWWFTPTWLGSSVVSTFWNFFVLARCWVVSQTWALPIMEQWGWQMPILMERRRRQ